MSRYVRKHRFKILGFAAPLFAVFVLVTIGLSIFPNQQTFGLPGDPCTLFDPNSACDACNGEQCVYNGASSTDQCANFPPPDLWDKL